MNPFDDFAERFMRRVHTDPRVDQVLAVLQQILTNQECEMATIADINLAIQAQTTVQQGVVALLQQLSKALTDAIATEDPTAVAAVVDMLNANTKALSDAVLANTPAAIGSATLATPVPQPVDGSGQIVTPMPTPAPTPMPTPEPTPMPAPADPNAPPHGE